MKPPILSERDIEARAGEILGEYSHGTSKAITAPIEKVLLQVLDIGVEWEPIVPRGERQIVSKFVQPTFGIPGRIVLNKALLETIFIQSPGLERTATAHETSHAVFHGPGAVRRGPRGRARPRG